MHSLQAKRGKWNAAAAHFRHAIQLVQPEEQTMQHAMLLPTSVVSSGQYKHGGHHVAAVPSTGALQHQ
jgi:hypothetical protein